MCRILYSRKLFHAKLIKLGISILLLNAGIALGTDEIVERIWLIPLKISPSAELNRELRFPEAVEMDSKGNIYIADSGYDRIIRLDSKLNVVARTSGWGASGDLLDNPKDICTQFGLNIFAADYQNGRIVRFDKNLNYVWDIKLNSLNEMWEYPVDITLSAWGELFILEENTGEVIRMESSNTSSADFGGFRIGAKAFLGAECIDVDEDGIVYISAPIDRKVFTFDRYGSPLISFELPFVAEDIDSHEGYCFVIGSGGIFCLKNNKQVEIIFSGEKDISFDSILDFAVNDGKLVLLFEKEPFISQYYLSVSPAEKKW